MQPLAYAELLPVTGNKEAGTYYIQHDIKSSSTIQPASTFLIFECSHEEDYKPIAG